MEGYFSIKSYCELTGISSDTAYHRVNRNQVEAIKEKDGRYFIYYSDENLSVPENFITLEDFAKANGLTVHCVRNRIRYGFYKEEDIFKADKCSRNGRITKTVYINKYTVGRPKIKGGYCSSNKTPKGFLSAVEWAAREEVSKPYLYYLIRNGKVPYIIEGGFYYIHEDTKWKWKRKEKTA